MKALLLAAGSSTRLYPLTRDLPKCLLPIGDRLLIDFLCSALEALGIQEKIVVTGFHREQIELQ